MSPHRGRGPLLPAMGLLASPALVVLAAAPSGAPTGTISVRTPLPTTIATRTGTWAALPMGDLNQRLNTFWQLFFLPAGGRGWTNQVGKLGVATNGGLNLSTPGGGGLVVGVVGAHLLHFTAVARTPDGGRTWTAGTPLPGSAESVAQLNGAGAAAIVTGREGGTLLTATSVNGTWRPLTTAAALRHSSAGAACRPRSLTAVALSHATGMLVGTDCGRAGGGGIFTHSRGRWIALPIAVPPTDRRSAADVVDLFGQGDGVGAVIAYPRASGSTDVVAAHIGGGRAAVSSPLVLGRGARLASLGSDGTRGAFVLIQTGSGAEVLATIARAGESWSHLPAPAGTATVAFPRPGRIDALAVTGTVMTDWTTRPGSTTWQRGSRERVTIEFGSS